jgi:GNAT superfamily N-acetyltransferase
MNIIYKPCRKQDLLPAFKLIRASMNHLRKSTGKTPVRFRIRRNAEVEHLFSQDKKTFWCAWAGNKIIGFTGALIRGNQWYLAFLFVHPRYQDKKIGRELLSRVWKDAPGLSHSLSTFSYNMQAVGIYSRFGMAPICALPIMELKLDKLNKPEPSGLKIITKPTKADIDWINRLEEQIRGYSHPQEWRFWSKNDKFQILIFKEKGKRVGYSMIHKEWGVIAPAGAVSNKLLKKVIADTFGFSGPKIKSLRICCPAQNIGLYRFLINRGFRLLEMDVFMSDKAYVDFQRYVPAQLAIF